MSAREPALLAARAPARTPAPSVVKSVSVRPTWNTLGFAALLLALWYAALSQGNGAAYALLFFIGGLGFVSWLHARRNLLGITLRAGLIEPVFAGTELRVPVTVTAPGGTFVAGVELRVGRAAEGLAVGCLKAGESVELHLPAPATLRGVYDAVEIELRSVWPLGVFAARSRVTIEASYVVQPAAHGPRKLPDTDPGWRHDRRKGKGDGDEFAGLREFRAGESPRRIHWRAAERSGVLLIKEWEGSSGGARWLDWAVLEGLDSEARLSQMARWVFDADRGGAPYGVRLPTARVEPGSGPAHRARCLQMLAAYPAEAQVVKVRPRPAPPALPILPGPFAALLIVLALAGLPMLSTVLPVAVALFGGTLLFRFVTRERGLAMTSVPLKLVVIGVVFAGVWMNGGSLAGLEPGMSLLLGLSSLKILESTTRRDFFVVMLLGWFLALCGLFASQTIFATLSAMVLCALAAGTSAMLHSEGELDWRPALKRVLVMAGQTLPLMVLLFLFFPRVQGGFRFSFTPGGLGAAGFSEDLDPGKFSKLNDNFETAFRAEILSGPNLAPADRYWRGMVLWESRGMRWLRGNGGAIEPRATKIPDDAIEQRITINPHGQRWVFALDRPLHPPKETNMEPGGFIHAYRPIVRTTRYTVFSLPSWRDKILPKEQRAAALAVPDGLPTRTLALGKSWRAAGGNDAAIYERALGWFRSQKFSYTLEPQRYEGEDALDQFLFTRQVGLCAHYASAFSTLMRVAGLPARVVIGYQGGEFNSHGSYFLVRQNEAHAWSEVWLEGRGWVRVDLTSELAPSRLEQGAQRFRDGAAAAVGAFQPPQGVTDLFNKARQLWDNINYQWDLRVVAFDDDAQFEFLAATGLKDVPKPMLFGGVLIGLCVFVGLGGLWLKYVTRTRRDPVCLAWDRACARILRLTATKREPWEGPQAYAARAASAKPELREKITALADLYVSMRYGTAAPNVRALREATRRMR